LEELVADLPPYLKYWTPRSHIARRLQGYLDEYMECREICIRAKWSLDGAKTLTDAAARLRDYAADLEGLATLGFELRDEVEDDYGFVGRPDDGGPVYPDDDDDEPTAG
jgi:hypothetical protein